MTSSAATLSPPSPPLGVGALLRRWRDQRRLSQMELALTADVSTRHLSFVETGRSKPSREMVVRLAEHLDVPLRERNELLLAAGYAPAYPESSLEDSELTQVRDAVRKLLVAHEPFPAIAVDRRWELVDGNAGVALITAGAAQHLLEPPVNALRLALHPEGMAPRIVNLAEWRAHLLGRLRREVTATQDPQLKALLAELSEYPGGDEADGEIHVPRAGEIVVPLRVRADDAGELAFMSTVTTFGTPLDITVSELSIEAFFPADDHTANVLRALV
ncbi:MAG TPA: helix-turn-helix transcriptional regulator [Baekduia sp.]|uniref:helix-turn-helix domain-containing protein n=1 Tax=Baekduia sp. TaxID=2600305 RepID=UPI002D77363D|nr:helix-turn-helix transcriptional regulator [Baekduia sp.]HET6509370.1 helix-turn-helix transcriptional regulator [Baekduia sp.]